MSIIKKINNKIGETIAETLVATLIAALSMVMFAGMVMASKTIVDETNKKIVEYYNGFSQLIIKEDVSSEDMDPIPITLYENKNGVMYYEYGKTEHTENSEESDD